MSYVKTYKEVDSHTPRNYDNTKSIIKDSVKDNIYRIYIYLNINIYTSNLHSNLKYSNISPWNYYPLQDLPKDLVTVILKHVQEQKPNQ